MWEGTWGMSCRVRCWVERAVWEGTCGMSCRVRCWVGRPEGAGAAAQVRRVGMAWVETRLPCRNG